MDEHELMTYAEVAKALHMKLGTLYAMVAQARIPHVRLGRRLVRFSRREIDAWLRQSAVRPISSGD